MKNRISAHAVITQGGRCACCESMLLRGAHAIEGENDTMNHPVNRLDYTVNKFIIVHPYFDNPEEHFNYQDSDKTMFDEPNCSKEVQETIKMLHRDELWAYNQRVATARTRDLPIDALALVGKIVTYRK